MGRDGLRGFLDNANRAVSDSGRRVTSVSVTPTGNVVTTGRRVRLTAGFGSRLQARLISLGLVEIDGVQFDHDVALEHGRVSKQRKKASKPLRARHGHTPLSLLAPIPGSVAR